MTTLDLHNAAIARLEAELAAIDVRERQKAQSYAELERMYAEMRGAVASAYELLRTWHDNTHSRNRPPIAILGHALGFDPLNRRDPPAQPTTTTNPFALVPAEDERAAVLCEQAAARLRRQSIGNAAAERVARAAIDAERETR